MFVEDDIAKIHRKRAAEEIKIEDRVNWIVNDSAELGVMVDGIAYFLYKGRSLIYKDGKHDDGTPMHYRPVFKREFGECCHPINYKDYSLIGTVSLEDSEDWQELQPYEEKEQ